MIGSEDALLVDQTSNQATSGRGAEAGSEKQHKQTATKGISSTVAAGVGKSANAGRQGELPCLFCETTDHRSSRCSSDVPVDSRRETLTRLKRCVKCFRPEHKTAGECRGPKCPCDICKSPKHYTAMHAAKNSPIRASAAPAMAPPVPITNAAVLSAAAEWPDSSTNAAATMVLTASALIVNGGQRIPVRIFLDNGSTDTFISPKVRRLIGTERPIYRATMAVQAFGSQYQLEVDKFRLRLSSFSGGKVFECSGYEHDFGVDPPNCHPPEVTRAIQRFNEPHEIADRSLLGEWPRTEPAIPLRQGYLNSVMTRDAI